MPKRAEPRVQSVSSSCRDVATVRPRSLMTFVLLWVLLPVVPIVGQDFDVNDFSRLQFIPRTYRPPLAAVSRFSFSGSAASAISDRIRSGRLAPDEKSRLLNSLFSSRSAELNAAIDETWGQGLPTDQKLLLFDQFWQTVEQRFACFHDLSVDWTALRDKYRPEVAGGVSRGRFAAIMNQLSIRLRESHTKAMDSLVNYQTRMLPGTPLFYVGGWGSDSHFGAGLTPLSDKSLLVYNAVADHPLGLTAGDIVLGYDGIPWRDLYPALLSAELPLTGSWWGSSPSAYERSLLMSAGNNWHLFDSIDIRKKASGEIVHLPTTLMEGRSFNIFATEQLPVPGVPMLTPTDVYYGQKYVSWGYVSDTNVGYIYVIGWSGNVADDFYEAVKAIAKNPETKGLIIDFRTNYGGNMHLINRTLPLLFKGRIPTIGFAQRADDKDHYAMVENWSGESAFDIVGDPNYMFDHPIAVLVGPGALSSGDQNALRMTFHPKAKLFGRPTTAAFNSPANISTLAGWNMNYAWSDAYLVSQRGYYLTRKDLKVDFPVWLAPHDVAVGRDTVVAAALSWINFENNGYRDCQQTRWIPHLTRAGSGFSTQVIVNNLADDPGVVEMRPYDAEGRPLPRQTVVVQGNGIQQLSVDQLFPDPTTTHFSICGPDSSKVTAVYRAENGEGPSVHVNEISDSGTEFLFYPETWNKIVDGIAIVNPGPGSVKITASLVTPEGVENQTVTLATDLKPYARYLAVLDTVLPVKDASVLRFTASNPIDLLVLRMNQDATVLYPVHGLKRK